MSLLNKQLLFRLCRSYRAVASLSTASVNSQTQLNNTEDAVGDVGRIEKISNAMRSYLELAKKHDDFMATTRAEYDLGKRHLANIMGWDPETVTQTDIDSAIEYLLPSGLYAKSAGPMMRPPEEIYPKRKAPQFDVLGKPHSHLFYTSLPNYSQVMHDIHANLLKLNDFEDHMIEKGILKAPLEARIDMTDSEWISYDDFRTKILELRLPEHNYHHMITSLETLAQHPYSSRIKSFFLQFRKELKSVASQMEIPPLTYDDTGRAYAYAEGTTGYADAAVTVRANGTGLVNINGKDLSYFDSFKEREQIMFPLQFTDLLFKVDIEATVKGGGIASQSNAIRFALSCALRSFVETNVVEDMRLAGLLTADIRKRERKMYGKHGPRRSQTFRKR